MISQGCAHARARVGDVIEPAAQRRNVAYREFYNSIKFRVKKLLYNIGPKVLYRSEEYNCQMHELMFQTGVKGMSERI